MVQALPIRINSFRPRHQVYYVGIDYVPNPAADRYYISKALMHKVMQISSYCKKYGKSVTAVLNSKTTPDYIPGLLATLGVSVLCVVDDPTSPIYGDFIVNEKPAEFIAENVEVVIVLKSEEADYEVETDTPIVYLTFPLLSPREKRTDQPNDVVEGFREEFRTNKDPYAVFDLGEQGERVFDDYVKRIMVAPEPTGVPKPLKLGNS